MSEVSRISTNLEVVMLVDSKEELYMVADVYVDRACGLGSDAVVDLVVSRRGWVRYVSSSVAR